MQVLVVGSGGREHALCWAFRRSPLCSALICAPGNAGIAEIADCAPVAADDVAGLVALARERAVDFVVVGPEVPLVLGLADRLREAGILAFGPGAAAAAIEGSKGFMKDLCARFGIPTADYERFDEPDAAKEYIRRHGAPLVVKADGLAAGKGVILCHNENEAFAAIDHIMTEGAFGDAGAEVVIEDLLQGEEVSFFALVNGEDAVPLASAQDHKAVHDGDQGPNTGGMGAYSPSPLVTPQLEDEIMRTVVRPAARGLVAAGCPYSGVLFAGLMLTRDGLRTLEFNARFGDPECQAIVVRLASDLLAALHACALGRMAEIALTWRPDPALVVVMAAKGYPGKYATGTPLRGLERAGAVEGVTLFHAGTRIEDGTLVASGGRVLGVTACAADVASAQRLAYRAVDLVDWPDGFCRRDIGWRAIARAGA